MHKCYDLSATGGVMLCGVKVKSEQMSCESFVEDVCHFIRLNATSSS